ncbi:hypothetical protein B566_EDAN009545 [Ephemera danica]|nr:hypothetical protein B566_EDAN009545 [Ephemera danica]
MSIVSMCVACSTIHELSSPLFAPAPTITLVSMHADAAPQQQQQLEAATVADNGVPTQQRKRKERHESAGSSQVAQDRKVIRSNSQERSSEDLEVTRSDTNATSETSSVPLLPLHEHNSSVAPMEDEDEETEHERRRSSERFASFPRSSTPRTSGSNRRFHQPRRQRRESKENHQQHEHQHHHAHRYQQQRHADDSCNSENISHAFLQLHPQEENETRERSPSPATPPVLDLSTLLQQVDCSEPLTSQAPHHRVPEDTNVLLSPRNSMILTRRLDPNVAPSPPVEHVSGSRRREDGNDSRAKQLSKNINSTAPLVNSRSMESTAASEDEPSATSDSRSLTDTLQEVERRLTEKREESGRPTDLEELSREQLLAEKVALQKALLHLESLHGRPASRTDRDLVRPLYDRYRSLKRLVVRSGGSKLRDSMSELATILEHEAMDFVATPEAPNTTAEAADTAGTAELPESGVTDDETPVISENLHALPISELLTRQQEARDEKKRLRRALREFEEEFQRDTGRRLQREDREPRQQEYMSYKQAKAKLRLLEALLAKHAQAPRSC